MLALYSVSTRRLSAFGYGVGDSHQTRVNAVLHPDAVDRHPLGRRRQPGRVVADELLAQVQPGGFLERQQRSMPAVDMRRLARLPAVAEFQDDRAVGVSVSVSGLAKPASHSGRLRRGGCRILFRGPVGRAAK